MLAGLVKCYQLVQPVDHLLLDGEGEERVLTPPPDLVVDDGLLVDNAERPKIIRSSPSCTYLAH
jgi:hypothetical protein